MDLRFNELIRDEQRKGERVVDILITGINHGTS